MWEKILIGFSLIILVIGMIAGPLLLFSNLNPASVQIKAASGIVEMSMNVRKENASYQIPLFRSTKTS